MRILTIVALSVRNLRRQLKRENLEANLGSLLCLAPLLFFASFSSEQACNKQAIVNINYYLFLSQLYITCCYGYI